MEYENTFFSGRGLRQMIVPLFFEQLLVMLVGMADTLVVSYVGEAAVSGVSLVNQFNTIFIYLFTALASGGAVVISQYIGRGDKCSAGICASQLLSFSTLFSVATAAVLLIGNEWILGLMFGRIENSVMEACVTYMRISAYSYPALAVYNVGAALQRSMGRTNVTMYVSAASNAINVIGNLIGVFVVHAGVAGVAYPSLAARVFSTALITWMCFRGGNGVCYSWREIFSVKAGYMNRILKIAVPNGLENGVFQLVKVALSGIVALFGTCQIAANGVAQSIWSMAALMGVAMGPVFITVIGQCMGRHDTDAADYYFARLLRCTFLLSAAWNMLVLLLMPIFLRLYALGPDTERFVIWLVVIHNVFNAAAYPLSGALSNGLRAAGDVKFTMFVSVASTLAVRLVLSYVLGITANLGVIGIAFAMAADWCVRALISYRRYKSGKWKQFHVI